MTGTQLYFAIGRPILRVLISLTVNLLQISGIRADSRSLRQEFADLRRDVNGALETIRREAREDRADFAGDLKLLTGKLVQIDNRLTRIEEGLDPTSSVRRPC